MNNQEESKQKTQASPPPEMKSCRECRQEIPAKAKKCHHCGSYQSRLNLLTYIPLGISFVIMLIAISQAILGYIQMNEAKQERISASQALKKAEKAESTANSTATKMQTLYQEAKNKVDEIEMMVSEAQSALGDIKTFNEFSLTLIKAENDERQAFDRLKEWAEDESYRFHLEAKRALQKVIDDHSQPFYKSGFTIPWLEGIDPSQSNMLQLRNTYISAPTYLKPALLEYIWKRNDISKRERLEFFIEVLQTDKSLKACEYAGRFFTEGTGLKIKPLAIDYFLNWWEENKNSFEISE